MKKYFKSAKFLLNKFPSHVIFFVTARCNASCKHCFYWENISEADIKQELKVDEIRKVSKTLGHIKALSLTGGEPFLRDDLADIARIFYENNDIHHLVVHSNGLMPGKIKEVSRAILKKCKGLPLVVSLSLDGFEAEHDSVRGVKGTYNKVLQTIEILQDLRAKHKNFEVDIISVVSHYNYSNIRPFMDFVRTNLKVDGHHIELVGGETREKIATDITPEQFKDIICYLRKTWTREVRKTDYALSSFKQVIDVLTPEIEMETMVRNKMILPCKAGKKVIVISEKGDVDPCEMLNMSFGNVRDYNYNMKKLLFSEKSKEIKEYIKKTRCFCTWGCAISNNIVFNMRSYPRIMKRWLILKAASSN